MLRRARHVGRIKIKQQAELTGAAYNLVRMARLLAASIARSVAAQSPTSTSCKVDLGEVAYVLYSRLQEVQPWSSQ